MIGIPLLEIEKRFPFNFILFDQFTYVTDSINDSFIYFYDDVVLLLSDINVIQACSELVPFMLYWCVFVDIKGPIITVAICIGC